MTQIEIRLYNHQEFVHCTTLLQKFVDKHTSLFGFLLKLLNFLLKKVNNDQTSLLLWKHVIRDCLNFISIC